jgi:trk system potassium uptake protein TrkA
MSLGHEVLAVDRDEVAVNDIAPDVTHAVQLDASDIDALKAIGAGEFNHAIVAISGAAEPSIFATMALKQLGVRNVVAKAGTSLHGSILERIGADRVVYPEREMGARVAHLFAYRNIVDYIDVAPGFGIVMLRPTETFVGRTIGELDLGRRLQLSMIGLRRGEHVTVNPHRDERIVAGDHLILMGRDAGFAQLPE